jgi:hypothetical protein
VMGDFLSMLNRLKIVFQDPLEKIYYVFRVTQHSKDIELIKLLEKFFGCGFVHKRSNLNTPRCDFIVQDKLSIRSTLFLRFPPPLRGGGTEKEVKKIIPNYPLSSSMRGVILIFIHLKV